jgi:aminoglycoside 3-N-acetyltransferase
VGTDADRRDRLDRARIAADLSGLGLPAGGDLIVHCGITRLGPIVGGAGAVVEALFDVAGPQATLVVPTQTANNSTTSPAYREATRGLSDEDRVAYEGRMPGFDPATTRSYRMGALAEYVRKLPDAHRSGHPQTSFAALGPRAKSLMAVHDLDCHLGEASPLGPLYHSGAWIVLLGVGFKVCTALHLAEYRVPHRSRRRPHRCFVMEDGRRVQRDFLAPHLDDHDFDDLGADLRREPFVRAGRVGQAEALALPMREAVDFAETWMHARP